MPEPWLCRTHSQAVVCGFVLLGLIGSTKTLHLNDARGIKTGEAPNKPHLEVMSGVHTHDSIENIAHPDNPVLQGEHDAALHLVPEVQATHVAVAAGGWSSRATWRDGQIPQAGSRVLIPEGIAVEVNDQFTAALDWIRINGELRFSTTVDTELRVDTLVSAPGSRLQIGTPDQPVNAGVNARVVFADRGPLSVAEDPMLLGRGAILHGATVVHGHAKTSALTAAEQLIRGDQQIVLEAIPQGWNVGDRLVIAGTSPDGSGDESVQIEAIDGQRIALDRPLQHDHLTPRDHLKVHVANLTRNVIFGSENKALDRRGHVMFMHTRDVDVANVAFNDLGRTDKSRSLDNPYFDEEGFFVEGTGTNAGGRYSVHFHRNGVDREGSPSLIQGSVVSGNPGWGFVNHSSYVDFIDNVAYDVYGSAFSTEAGDEIGSFQNNIAIRMHGTGEEPILRQEEGDFGHAGDGFWLQGPGVRVEGNVASGATGSGLILYAEPLFEDGLGITLFPAANLSEPGLANGDPTVPVSLAPLARFAGNESYGSVLGAQIYYHRTLITIEEDQEEQASLLFPSSLMEDMDLWSNANGMRINYTVDTDFKDIRILGPVDGSGDTGFDAADNFYNRGTHQYDNLLIEDYEIGFSAPRSGIIEVKDGYFNNTTDFYLNEPRQLGRRIRFAGDLSFGDRAFGMVEGERIPRNYFEMDPELAPAADSANEHFLLDDQVLLDFGPYRNQQLYFFEQSADHVLFNESPEQLTPDDPGPTVGEEFIGVTNAEIRNRLGKSFGGALAPDDARELDRISGLVGSPAPNRPVLDPNPLPQDDDEAVDDPQELVDPRELELGLPEDGGRSQWLFSGRALSDLSGDNEPSVLEGIDHVAMFGSDQNDSILLKFDTDEFSELDQLDLLTGAGRDRVKLVGSPQQPFGQLEVVIEGERGPDRLDARRYGGSVVLEGGSGRDLLIGGRHDTELWGGAGRDTFWLRSGGGVQRLQDFDLAEDRLVLKKIIARNLSLEERNDDLLLLNGDQPLAVFVDLVEQQSDMATLLGLASTST